jgi:DNA-binding response OmpR family regulator
MQQSPSTLQRAEESATTDFTTTDSATADGACVVIAAYNPAIAAGLLRYFHASSFHASSFHHHHYQSSIAPSHGRVTETLRQSLVRGARGVVVLELSMQSKEGFETIAAIRRSYPEVKILAIGNYTMPSLVKLVFKSGADGYLLSMPSRETMLEAVESLLRNARALDEQLAYIRFALGEAFAA